MTWMIPVLLAAQMAMPAVVSRVADAPSTSMAMSWRAEADPADSVLRAASARMARGDYRGAAELFRSVTRRFPTSMRLSEAMYYEAFALYRAGDLSQARGALDLLRSRFPQRRVPWAAPLAAPRARLAERSAVQPAGSTPC